MPIEDCPTEKGKWTYSQELSWYIDVLEAGCLPSQFEKETHHHQVGLSAAITAKSMMAAVEKKESEPSR